MTDPRGGFWLAMALLLAAASPVDAADTVRHSASQRPHWEVGDIDVGLSEACRRNRFNQISDTQRYIAYRGETGAGVTGIARQGWNLRDPEKRSAPEATYHFADDGLSTCRVYVSKEKNPAAR